jgi:hypothetical protein
LRELLQLDLVFYCASSLASIIILANFSRARKALYIIHMQKDFRLAAAPQAARQWSAVGSWTLR